MIIDFLIFLRSVHSHMSYLEAKRLYKGQIHGIRKTHLYQIYSGIQNLLKNFNATIYKITVQASL